MRTHTQAFKNEIKNAGRQIDAVITYTNEQSGSTILGNDKLNSINFHYEGSILKSVMKVLEIDCNEAIEENKTLLYRLGVKVRDNLIYIDYRMNYDYVGFGRFIVNKIEKQENTNSYLMKCYDKMIYAMAEYEDLGITYPISVRDYISAICTKLGITFANANDTFINYDKMINEEPYLDADGNSMKYTYRDVLDELAQVTASTICINNDDELELKYITDSQETITEEYLKNINVNFGEIYGAINTIVLSRSNGLDKISKSIPADLPDEDKIALEIAENRILNGDDRGNYIDGILNELYGLQYCVNDFDSTGIIYLDLCDKYDVEIGNETYSCIMINDEINVNRGLTESIHTEKPENCVQEYQYMTETDKTVRNAEIIINKKIGEVDIRGKTINLTADDINISSNNFSVTDEGVITATAGKIADYNIVDGRLYNEVYTNYDYTSSDRDRLRGILAGTITPTQEDYNKYDFNNDETLNSADLAILNQILVYDISTTTPLIIELASAETSSLDSSFKVRAGNNVLTNIGIRGITTNNLIANKIITDEITSGNINGVYLKSDAGITSATVTTINGYGIITIISSQYVCVIQLANTTLYIKDIYGTHGNMQASISNNVVSITGLYNWDHYIFIGSNTINNIELI